jgi:hypothetical protein
VLGQPTYASATSDADCYGSDGFVSDNEPEANVYAETVWGFFA